MNDAQGALPHGNDIFLSSCFRDDDPTGADTDSDLRRLREETRRRFAREGLSVWTWEHWVETGSYPDLAFASAPFPPDSFANIGVFRKALIESKAVIVFVSKRRGSQVVHWPQTLTSYGTFFEIEVFFAIALKKPIILFREPGADAEAPLEELLKVARAAGGIVHEEWIPRRELPRRSFDVYSKLSAGSRSPIGRFTASLAKARDPVLDFTRITPFLFGQSLPPLDKQVEPNVDAFDFVLAAAQDPALPLSERMSRTWLALQELLPFRTSLARDPELLRRWLAALNSWSDAASWFGLHSHLAVSPLVAHAEQARLIAATSSTKLAIPYGPLSSARYSMARRQPPGLRRRREMRTVIEEAGLAIETHHGDEAGYLSIIGFAFIQNGNPWQSVGPFEQSLDRRKQEGHEGRLGEGLADLGFALFLSLRFRRGLDMMREGVAHLERSNLVGPYLRALRKLELACVLTLRRDEARALRERRLTRAAAEEYFDQA
jgi:hypothetical protein